MDDLQRAKVLYRQLPPHPRRYILCLVDWTVADCPTLEPPDPGGEMPDSLMQFIFGPDWCGVCTREPGLLRYGVARCFTANAKT
jgi:hypothetical protein